MLLRDFLNRMKILRGIDSHELIKVSLTHNQWLTFAADPIAFLIHQDDDVVSKVWAIVEARSPAPAAPLPTLSADSIILAAALASTRSLARAVAGDHKAGAATKEIARITADQTDDALEALKRVEKGAG